VKKESTWTALLGLGLNDVTGIELPVPARKTIDLEGRIVKDGIRKIVTDRQLALAELVKAISELRKFSDQPLPLRAGDYAGAVQALKKAIDRANGLLQSWRMRRTAATGC